MAKMGCDTSKQQNKTTTNNKLKCKKLTIQNKNKQSEKDEIRVLKLELARVKTTNGDFHFITHLLG